MVVLMRLFSTVDYCFPIAAFVVVAVAVIFASFFVDWNFDGKVNLNRAMCMCLFIRTFFPSQSIQ